MNSGTWLLLSLVSVRVLVELGGASYRRGRALAEKVAAVIRPNLVMVDSGIGFHAAEGARPHLGWGYLFSATADQPPELGVYVTLLGKVLFSDGPLAGQKSIHLGSPPASLPREW